jgi:hypothetical protein
VLRFLPQDTQQEAERRMSSTKPRPQKLDQDLTELELRRVLRLSEAADLTSLSEDSLKRNHANKVRRLSPRRLGMTVRDALAIIGEQS